MVHFDTEKHDVNIVGKTTKKSELHTNAMEEHPKSKHR